MSLDDIKKKKFIIDLEALNTHNAEGCAACGRKFNLGDTVVVACGGWGDTPKLIHESEAVFVSETSSYVERRCHEAMKS